MQLKGYKNQSQTIQIHFTSLKKRHSREQSVISPHRSAGVLSAEEKLVATVKDSIISVSVIEREC